MADILDCNLRKKLYNVLSFKQPVAFWPDLGASDRENHEKLCNKLDTLHERETRDFPNQGNFKQYRLISTI